MGYLGRRIGRSADTGNPTADGTGGGFLDAFTNGYFQRQGNIYNAPGIAPMGISATGGTTNDYTVSTKTYRAHVFTSSGAFNVNSLSTDPLIPNALEYVVVAGGGGGATGDGYGGGGAGGYRSSVIGENSGGGNSAEPTLTASVGPYTVTIGAGGPQGDSGSNGSPTVFGPITSTGGGGGARMTTGGAGGSGGGAGDYPRGGRSGPANNYPGPSAQGYPGSFGASDQANFTAGGGGGGASAAGEAVPTGPNPFPHPTIAGGNGIRTAIAGPSYPIGTPGPATPGGTGGGPSTAVTGGWLAGGGGGLRNSPVERGAGGAGGGGGLAGANGTTNTGGGGSGSLPGSGAGGSGIVIVRYQINSNN